MIEQILGSMSGIFWIFLIIIPLLLLKALLKNPKIKGSLGGNSSSFCNWKKFR